MLSPMYNTNIIYKGRATNVWFEVEGYPDGYIECFYDIYSDSKGVMDHLIEKLPQSEQDAIYKALREEVECI